VLAASIIRVMSNIKMDLKEIDYEVWTGFLWQALMNMIMKLQVP
jgi:hypothetical protein